MIRFVAVLRVASCDFGNRVQYTCTSSIGKESLEAERIMEWAKTKKIAQRRHFGLQTGLRQVIMPNNYCPTALLELVLYPPWPSDIVLR